MKKRVAKKKLMNRHFNKRQLLAYAMPSVVMMFTISIYEIVDGFFISNFVSSTAFAAVNLIFPVLVIIGAFGLMMGSGSSVAIANKLGEDKPDIANKYFSLFVYFTIALGITLAIIAYFIMEPVAKALGAEGELLDISVYYGWVSLISIPAYVIQMACTSWFNTAGRPNVGFMSSIFSGVIIISLDFVLVAIYKLGINGTLIATIISEYVGGLFPLWYFSQKDSNSLIRLVSPLKVLQNGATKNSKLVLRACINGSSETIQEIAMSLVVMLCVFQLNRFSGEAGIVAYGVIEYAWVVFNAFYMGFSIAVSPLMSFQQGAKNLVEMKSLFKNCFIIIAISSVIASAIAYLTSGIIASVFVGYDQSLMDLTVHAIKIYCIAFLFCGFSVYISNLFTSLGKGIIATGIAFSRSILFESVGLLVLPEFFALDGIWFASSLAEVFATIVALILLGAFYKKLFKV